MEEKELDFSELLKEHIGEMFFSYMYGDVILRDVNRSFCSFVTNNGNGDKVRVFSLCPLKTGYAPIYPSKDLFLKYPLDAAKAWEEWKENKTHKYFVSVYVTDCKGESRLIIQYGFKTQRLAEQATEKVRECIMKFGEEHKEE